MYSDPGCMQARSLLHHASVAFLGTQTPPGTMARCPLFSLNVRELVLQTCGVHPSVSLLHTYLDTHDLCVFGT